MCRIAFAKFTDKTVNKKEKIAAIARNSINLGNRDGIGIYDIDNGKVIKSIKPAKFFKLLNRAKLGNNIIIHARQSTNAICHLNTQPLIIDGLVIAHNGVIHTTQYKLKYTTNDSEYLAHAYIENNKNMDDTIESLDGYYNFIMYDIKTREISFYADNTTIEFYNFNDSEYYAVQEIAQLDGIYNVSNIHGDKMSRYEMDVDYYIRQNIDTLFDENINPTKIVAKPMTIQTETTQTTIDKENVREIIFPTNIKSPVVNYNPRYFSKPSVIKYSSIGYPLSALEEQLELHIKENDLSKRELDTVRTIKKLLAYSKTPNGQKNIDEVEILIDDYASQIDGLIVDTLNSVPQNSFQSNWRGYNDRYWYDQIY